MTFDGETTVTQTDGPYQLGQLTLLPFALDRPLFLLDCETSGTNEQTARILELAFQEFRPHVGLVREFQMYFNPQTPIPEGATKVHGLTNEFLQHQALFKTHAANIAAVLSNCDFAGKHVRFDLKVLASEMRRAGVAWEYGEQPERVERCSCQGSLLCIFCSGAGIYTLPAVRGARIVDADRLEQLGEPRTLADLYRKHIKKRCPDCAELEANRKLFGGNLVQCDESTPLTSCETCGGTGLVPAEMTGAHGALADVRGTRDVIAAQMEKYTAIPRDLDELHALQWPGFIDTEGKFRFRDGVPVITFGKWRDMPMAEVERDYWRWLGGPKSDFSEEVKRIARAAARGEFPQAPVEVKHVDDDQV